MNKFEKRILSASSSRRNCLVVGSGLGAIDDIINTFSTVFIVYGDRTIKGRHIVHREDLKDVKTLPDIDFMFLDYHQYNNIRLLQPLLLRYKPVVLVGGAELWPPDEYKFMHSQGFNLVEIFKNMHKWIPR